MVIDNFDVLRTFGRPHETHPPLVVYPDAVLSDTIPDQRFQPIPRGRCQIAQFRDRVQLPQLAARDRLDIGEAGDATALMQALCVGAFEGLDRHGPYCISVSDIAQWVHT
jgi:hypothetical protein